MDTLKIECFLAVAETQSYSKAANLLFKNQSVISRQILALEKELGVQLFNRSSRAVILTAAGQVFEAGIRKISSIYHVMLDDIMATQNGYSGEVKICTHPGNLYFNDLIPIIQAFEKQHPEICVSLIAAYSGDASQCLDDRRVDFVFWRWEEYSNNRRDCICVSSMPNGLLVLPDHPAAAFGTPPTLIDFRDDIFIVLPDKAAPGLGNRLLRKCHETGFEPKMIVAPDLDTSLLWISARRGIIAMNSHGICAENPAFRYVVLPELGNTEFSFIWDKSNDNPCLDIFLRFVSEFKKHSPANHKSKIDEKEADF